MTPPVVAYQGAPGAFGELAALAAGGGEPRGFNDFDDVVTALRAGTVARAVLPVENSLIGPIERVWTALAALAADPGEVRAVAEVIVPVHHCLIRPAGAPAEPISRVLSHPAALAQCRRYFALRPDLVAEGAFDTAGALDQAAGRAGVAVIASERAAELRGATVLERHLEDDPRNATRFLVFARGPAPPTRAADRALCVFDGSGPTPGRHGEAEVLVSHPCSEGWALVELAAFSGRLSSLLAERRPKTELGRYPAAPTPFPRLARA